MGSQDIMVSLIIRHSDCCKWLTTQDRVMYEFGFFKNDVFRAAPSLSIVGFITMLETRLFAL